MNAAFDSTGAPKTLYVGNLAHQCTEDLVMVLFNQIGPVKVRKRIYFLLMIYVQEVLSLILSA